MNILSLLVGAVNPLAGIALKLKDGLVWLVSKYFELWRVTVPLTVALLGGMYHFHITAELNQQITGLERTVERVNTELRECGEKKDTYSEALTNINTQLTQMKAEQEAALAQLASSVKAADADAAARSAQILAAARRQLPTIPTDCRGALDWLKVQRYSFTLLPPASSLDLSGSNGQ